MNRLDPKAVQAMINLYFNTPKCSDCGAMKGMLHEPDCSHTPQRRVTNRDIGRMLFPVQEMPEKKISYFIGIDLASNAFKAPAGLPPGTRVRVHPSTTGPGCLEGVTVEERPQHGGYLVRHDGDTPGPFGWGYSELECLDEIPVIECTEDVALPWE